MTLWTYNTKLTVKAANTSKAKDDFLDAFEEHLCNEDLQVRREGGQLLAKQGMYPIIVWRAFHCVHELRAHMTTVADGTLRVEVECRLTGSRVFPLAGGFFGVVIAVLNAVTSGNIFESILYLIGFSLFFAIIPPLVPYILVARIVEQTIQEALHDADLKT